MKHLIRLITLLAALALAACTALPDSGPVNSSQPRLPDRSEVDVLYSGPTANAPAVDIVEGFLAASAAGYSDDFAAARLYLTESAAQSWNPHASVDIIASDEPQPPEEIESGAVRVTHMSLAELDSRGRYTAKRQPVESVRTFSLMKNADGQWRIAALPDGLAIPDVRFDQIFDRVPIYFYSPDAEVLVPEPRWFARPQMVSGALAALLSGPSSWLQPAVRTAVPDGARIQGGVTVTDDTVSVDLDVPERPDPEDLQRLYVQVQRTLAGAAGIQSVTLRLDGSQVIPAATTPLIDAPGAPAQPVAISEGSLVRFNGRDLVPVPGADQLPGPLRAPSAPYEGSSGSIVVLDGAGEVRTVASGQSPSEVLLTGSSLIPPSIDRLGWVLTGEQHNTGSLIAVQHAGEQITVAAPWLAGQRVTRVRISADGSRAIVLVSVGDALILRVAAVTRDDAGRPIELASPVDVVLPAGQVLDADWVGASDLAVLVRNQLEEQPDVVLSSLGGPRVSLSTVAGGVQIAAGTSDRSIIVTTSEGELFVRAGGGWRAAASGVSDPNYAG